MIKVYRYSPGIIYGISRYEEREGEERNMDKNEAKELSERNDERVLQIVLTTGQF